MNPPLFQFHHVTKRFGDRVLLNIDQFSVREGVCALISGDNGAGKTTLLKIVSGLVKPDSAKMYVKGVEMSWARARAKIQRNVVYLHQDPYMLDTSVERNVAYGLRLHNEPRAHIYEKVAEVLRWARLDHLAHRNARSLSGGEKQRVALTRARIVNPSVLALDEPTTNMDQQSRISTYQLIDELRNEGMAILVASHDQTGFTPIADHHAQLVSGKLIEVETAFRRSRGTNITRFPG
jgi:tungstate transport system ATP-binding protein